MVFSLLLKTHCVRRVSTGRWTLTTCWGFPLRWPRALTSWLPRTWVILAWRLNSKKHLEQKQKYSSSFRAAAAFMYCKQSDLCCGKEIANLSETLWACCTCVCVSVRVCVCVYCVRTVHPQRCGRQKRAVDRPQNGQDMWLWSGPWHHERLKLRGEGQRKAFTW